MLRDIVEAVGPALDVGNRVVLAGLAGFLDEVFEVPGRRSAVERPALGGVEIEASGGVGDSHEEFFVGVGVGALEWFAREVFHDDPGEVIGAELGAVEGEARGGGVGLAEVDEESVLARSDGELDDGFAFVVGAVVDFGVAGGGAAALPAGAEPADVAQSSGAGVDEGLLEVGSEVVSVGRKAGRCRVVSRHASSGFETRSP